VVTHGAERVNQLIIEEDLPVLIMEIHHLKVSCIVSHPAPYNLRVHVAPVSGRLRSGSNANAPPISATNPQTAFIKIKIFDRTSDDLIAIRVSPRVSHRQLLEKVRERLGGEIRLLNYRDPSNTRFVPLDGDDQLRDWLEHTDKHVLYAE
jgi:bud emergence protein 1